MEPADLDALMQDLLRDRPASAAVLITPAYALLHRLGQTDRYLDPAAGPMRTQNMLAATRKGLRGKVRTAVQQALREGREVNIPDARVLRAGYYHAVRLTARPTPAPEPHRQTLVLVTFDDKPAPTPSARPPRGRMPAAAHSNLQAAVHRLERAYQKLETAHQHAQSMNQTLQAANDELRTLTARLQENQRQARTRQQAMMAILGQQAARATPPEQEADADADAHQSVEEALRFTVEQICAAHGWRLGRAFWPSADAPGQLTLFRTWRIDPSQAFTTLDPDDAAEYLDPAPALASRAMETGRPVWADAPQASPDPASGRACNADPDRLYPTLAFPACIGEEVVAVLEFFADAPAPPDGRLLEMAPQLGIQLGRVVERTRSENALRESQRFIQSVADAAPFLLYVLDVQEKRNIYTNARLQAMLGSSPAQLAERGPALLEAAAHPDDRAVAEEGLARAMRAADGQIVEFEHRVLDVEGQIRWMHIRNLVLRRDPDGTVRQIFGTAEDITDRKRLERELAELAVQEQQRIGQELHDKLGQELTGLAYLAHGLHDKLGRDGRPEAAEADDIARGVRRALEDVRTLARGLFPGEVDALTLAPALNDLVRQTADRYAIDCRLDCDASLTATQDDAVANHLFRIVQEAITNAVKHASPTRVTVTLRKVDRQLRVTVQDNGCGLPAHHDQRPGMGLRVMRHRASVIGAELEVTSPEGGGTAVHCVLKKG